MNAGELRHRIMVDIPQTAQDDTGAEEIDWTPYGCVWGAIEPLRGRERLDALGIGATATTRIRLRWSPNMDQMNEKWRLRHGAVIYNIESIAHTDMGRREIEVICNSGRNVG